MRAVPQSQGTKSGRTSGLPCGDIGSIPWTKGSKKSFSLSTVTHCGTRRIHSVALSSVPPLCAAAAHQSAAALSLHRIAAVTSFCSCLMLHLLVPRRQAPSMASILQLHQCGAGQEREAADRVATLLVQQRELGVLDGAPVSSCTKRGADTPRQEEAWTWPELMCAGAGCRKASSGGAVRSEAGPRSKSCRHCSNSAHRDATTGGANLEPSQHPAQHRYS